MIVSNMLKEFVFALSRDVGGRYDEFGGKSCGHIFRQVVHEVGAGGDQCRVKRGFRDDVVVFQKGRPITPAFLLIHFSKGSDTIKGNINDV